MQTLILKGSIVHAPKFGEVAYAENGYLVTEGGCIEGVYQALPERFSGAPVEDFGDALLMPSFVDMHLHAPQYAMLGMGMDLQLLEWLNTYTFPVEARLKDTAYARSLYRELAAALIRLGTTRVCIYSTIHRESTHILMEELERAGVTGYVGKVNMDRNSPDFLRETTEESLSETERWVKECEGRYVGLHPMLTPRFTPSCTDGLLRGLGELSQKYGLPVQSHLSENLDEIRWVQALCPDCGQYWESYDRYGLLGAGTVMAHCVYSDERERGAMKSRGVYVAHCPDSNINIASGIAPIRRMLNEGMLVTLGSDIAGGAQLCMMDVATEAIRTSKRNWLDTQKREAFLTTAEAFYLITSAGQQYFGEGPGFQKGDRLHALAISDSACTHIPGLTLTQRLERLMYLTEARHILARYSDGRRVG